MKSTREVADAIDALCREGRVTERAAGAVEGAPPMTDAPTVAGRVWGIPILNWNPARLNQLMGHWSKGARLKKADREMIAYYAQRYGVPKATGKRRVTLRIVLAKGQRGADGDAYWKSTLDGLVHAGLLVDDNRQNCELMPVEYARAEKRATVITLMDI